MPKDVRKCLCCPEMQAGLCRHIHSASPDTFKLMVGSYDLDAKCTLGPGLGDGIHLMQLASGLVKLSLINAAGEEDLLDFVPAGEIGQVGNQANSAIVATALKPSRVCLLVDEVPATMVADCAKFYERLNKLRLRQTERMRTRLALLQIRNVVQRLAAFLITQASATANGSGHFHVQLAYSREDIANYLHMSPSTVSRSFTALERSGLISMDVPTRITCFNHDAWRTIRSHVGM